MMGPTRLEWSTVRHGRCTVMVIRMLVAKRCVYTCGRDWSTSACSSRILPVVYIQLSSYLWRHFVNCTPLLHIVYWQNLLVFTPEIDVNINLLFVVVWLPLLSGLLIGCQWSPTDTCTCMGRRHVHVFACLSLTNKDAMIIVSQVKNTLTI